MLTGLMARTVADIKLLDTVLNDCPRVDPQVQLEGIRLGYPTNWWKDIGEEVHLTFQCFTAASVAMYDLTEGLTACEFLHEESFTSDN